MVGPIDFENIFDRIPSPYMMLDRQLRYVAANRAYLGIVARGWDELEGVQIFDAFPAEGESRKTLEDSLLRARDSGKTDVLPLIHYAIQRPQALGGGFEDRLWSATHTPIAGPNGETAYILQHTQDVTEIQRLKDVAFAVAPWRRRRFSARTCCVAPSWSRPRAPNCASCSCRPPASWRWCGGPTTCSNWSTTPICG